MIVKPYPKDNEARTFGVREQWLDAVGAMAELDDVVAKVVTLHVTVLTPHITGTRSRTWRMAHRASVDRILQGIR